MWLYSVAIQPLRALAAYYCSGDPSCKHFVTKTHTVQEKTHKQIRQRIYSGSNSFSRGTGGRKGIKSLFNYFSRGPEGVRYRKKDTELTLELLPEEAGVTKLCN